MLWPEQGNKLAYANLRKTLFRLQSLPWARADRVAAAALFASKPRPTCPRSSRRCASSASPMPSPCAAASCSRDSMTTANEAWSSWLSFERDRLRVAWRDAALDRLAADIDTGEGIDLSARLLEADPLDEAALRAHMSWLARDGQGGARAPGVPRVRRTPRGGSRACSGRRAEGAARFSRHGGRTACSRRRRRLPRRPTTASSAATVELRRMAALLAQDDCRLLCLIGPGGVGKTRLAQRAIQELAPGYPDGAAFVPLEDISSSSELGGRLAREMGVRLAGSGEPLDQVIEFLRERQMLLVLDNFEHLAADASMLEQAARRRAARLQIIVTSRVRLARRQGVVAAARRAAVPGDRGPGPCRSVRRGAPVRPGGPARRARIGPRRGGGVDRRHLPAGRGTAAGAGARGGVDARAVLRCDRRRAAQGTELLHAVDAARPARHASIEVVFDQSWRLLSAIERDALSRLSVFRGGFSAEAARAIAAASLPVLGALADKSLLRKDGARIFMHPLVQQLGRPPPRRGRGPRIDGASARAVLSSPAGVNCGARSRTAIATRCKRSIPSSRTAASPGAGRSRTRRPMRWR